MKMFVVAVNLAILTTMAVVYTNHVRAAEVDQLILQIQIEKTVAQVLLGQ
jgi:hypothetical protein